MLAEELGSLDDGPAGRNQRAQTLGESASPGAEPPKPPFRKTDSLDLPWL
jgi:hypothetical protein